MIVSDSGIVESLRHAGFRGVMQVFTAYMQSSPPRVVCALKCKPM